MCFQNKNFFKNICFLLGGLFLVFLFLNSVSFAQGFEDFKKPLPDIEFIPEDEFNASSLLYKGGQSDLAFEIRLPKDWTTQSGYSSTLGGGEGNALFGELARYYGPTQLMIPRSYLTIEVVSLNYQLTAEQWFLQFILENGFAIQGMNVYNDREIEALFVSLIGNDSFAVRSKVFLSGRNIVMARYYMPVENWEVEKKSQASIIRSFKMENLSEENVEKMLVYQFLDVAEMKFPASWTLHSPRATSVEKMSVSLLNIAGDEDQASVKTSASTEYSDRHVLEGKIDVNILSAFAADSLESELNSFKENLNDQGLILKNHLEADSGYIYNPDFSFAKVDVFEASDTSQSNMNYELWLGMLAANDYYFFVTLLTPSRDQDYFVWSRNTQTYKLILNMIEPTDSSIWDVDNE